MWNLLNPSFRTEIIVGQQDSSKLSFSIHKGLIISGNCSSSNSKLLVQELPKFQP